MTRFNRLARRAALLASFAFVALAATAVPLKPAAAGWHGYRHPWYGGGVYGGGVFFGYSAPRYYYAPAPVYYAPPPPVYYAPPPVYYPPAPYYGPPSFSLGLSFPLH